MFNNLFKIFLSVAFMIFFQNVNADTHPQPKVTQFISIADIHFDPFLSCHKTINPCSIINILQKSKYQEWAALFEKYGNQTIGGAYQDTNYPLFKMTLIKLKETNYSEKPAFVIILGDNLAHEYREKYIKYTGDKSRAGYQAFIKKTLAFLAYQFAEAFPNIDIYSLVGNNDSYTGDYSSIPQGSFFHDTSHIWGELIKNKVNKSSFLHDFPKAGYYEVTLPNKNQKIIVLNTVLFSTRIQNPVIHKAALMQLEWLHTKLDYAEKHHQQVILAYHIPSGVDVFATLTNFGNIKEFWQASYTQQFEKELKTHANIIQWILAAHIHTETFQRMTLKSFERVPVKITPSISPIFGNNPAFKVFNYDSENLHLKNIDTYSYPLNQSVNTAKWQKYSSYAGARQVRESIQSSIQKK